MKVNEFELIRMNDGGEVKVWADGQIDILRESHMTVGFREAKRRQATVPEGRTMEMPTAGEIRLACGELTAGEMRTVKAALGWFIQRHRPQAGSGK